MDEALIHLILFAGAAVFALVMVVRGERKRRKRKKIRAKLLSFWKRKMPGVLVSRCPLCRLPYPVAFEICPYCESSRRKARMVRRDQDWSLETRAGYPWWGT